MKHFWKLLLTPASKLRYDNYWSRRNFSYAQLTDTEVIHRLLDFDDNLKQAYRYYQDLEVAISQQDKEGLDQLLSIKWTHLPQALQKVQQLYGLTSRKSIIASNTLPTPTDQLKELIIKSK